MHMLNVAHNYSYARVSAICYKLNAANSEEKKPLVHYIRLFLIKHGALITPELSKSRTNNNIINVAHNYALKIVSD